MATSLFSNFNLKVSETTIPNYLPVEGSACKFSPEELKAITNAVVLECNGEHGSYKKIKVTLNINHIQHEFWETLDKKSEHYEHMTQVDPASLYFYQLCHKDTGEIIRRVSIKK